MCNDRGLVSPSCGGWLNRLWEAGPAVAGDTAEISSGEGKVGAMWRKSGKTRVSRAQRIDQS